MSTHTILVWFRRDLRLDDNPALNAAALSGRPVLPVYVLDQEDPWPMGGAAKWWLHHALVSLSTSLAKIGLPLVLRRGTARGVIRDLAVEAEAGAVYWNRDFQPHAVERDSAIKCDLRAKGLTCESFPGDVLLEPWELVSGSGGPYRVFTPFHKALIGRIPPPKPHPPPRSVRPHESAVGSDALASWALLPSSPDWAKGLRDSWTPGEDGARRRLLRFVDDAMSGYDRSRDHPAIEGSSRLAPHLAFGELGTRRAWHMTAAHPPGPGRDAFLRQLAWREFSRHLLFHFPEMPNRPLRPAFEAFPWVDDSRGLAAWQKGSTGYPIVDAGMRQLWRTGWMHNRVRMIVASFLTKHLRVDWRHGAAWFWDTLVDADLGNNAAGWQWVAGCGADASPYFRVFNPTLQGRKFDHAGDYVRRWVPELAFLPNEWIHQPWLAQGQILADANVTLGRDYPLPIIDHATARTAALTAYRSIRA